MAKSFVITNSHRLNAFLSLGGKIEDIEIRAGQLTGKPRYAPGHVGRKSRIGGSKFASVLRRGSKRDTEDGRAELSRQAMVRGLRAQLGGISDDTERRKSIAMIRKAFRTGKVSSRGLVRSSGTAVARVAGVMASQTGYHVNSIVDRRGLLRRELDELLRDIKRGRPAGRMLQQIGQSSKAAIRRGIARAGLVDTGKLLRNTGYEITTISGKAAFRAAAKRERAWKRANPKPRKRRKPRAGT